MPNWDGSKSGGRQKGTANRLTAEYKDLIIDSNPIQFLIDAYTSGQVGNDKLSAKERCDIAQTLSKKIVPDLKSVEYSGKDGGNIIIETVQYRMEHAKDVTTDANKTTV